MSIEMWRDPNTGKRYPIGTMGWEGAQKFSQILDALVPTYGFWAGPGWAGFSIKKDDSI